MRFPAVSASRSKLLPAVLLLGIVLGLGGCVSNSGGGPMNAQASMSPAGGPTVAFESIDGPPPQVFERMVSVLDSEAKLRSLAVVSRQDSAAFRVRSYLSAQVRGSNTSIAWVWDVYDRDQNRAFRLRGEEATGKGGSRDAWGTADDLTLRRIAQSGLTGLNGMINGTAPAENAPEPAPAVRGPAMANTDELPSQATAFADVR